MVQKRERPMEGTMATWLHLRTHHLWRTIKEVGLLSDDHLPQSMTTQPVQLLQSSTNLSPSQHLTFCTPHHILHKRGWPRLPFPSPFASVFLAPPLKDCGLPTGEALFPSSLAGPLYILFCSSPGRMQSLYCMSLQQLVCCAVKMCAPCT